MKADGKSLDDKRNLLVEPEVFEAFSFDGIVTSSKVAKQRSLSEAEMHDNFNLPDILARYPQRMQDNRARTEQSFLVPFKEIKENNWDLSINRYKEIVYEEVEYDAPEVILKRINKLDQERKALMKDLM